MYTREAAMNLRETCKRGDQDVARIRTVAQVRLSPFIANTQLLTREYFVILRLFTSYIINIDTVIVVDPIRPWSLQVT